MPITLANSLIEGGRIEEGYSKPVLTTNFKLYGFFWGQRDGYVETHEFELLEGIKIDF